MLFCIRSYSVLLARSSRTQFKLLGVTLSLEGGRIRYEPRSSVQGDDLERLKSYRVEVVKLLEYDPLSDGGWSGHWRERIQTRLQALENWVWCSEYDVMRVANNGLPKAREQAREKLTRWYLFVLEHEAVSL